MNEPRNRLTLDGTLVARDSLRYTPAGVPILKFSVRHSSQQSEAGAQRAVEAEVRCVAVETQARQMATAPLGMGLRLAGFLAPQGKSSRQLVLHVTELEFAEGD